MRMAGFLVHARLDAASGISWHSSAGISHSQVITLGERIARGAAHLGAGQAAGRLGQRGSGRSFASSWALGQRFGMHSRALHSLVRLLLLREKRAFASGRHGLGGKCMACQQQSGQSGSGGDETAVHGRDSFHFQSPCSGDIPLQSHRGLCGKSEQLRARLKRGMEYYRRNRDLSIIITLGVYFLTMLDAYVDAELFDFNISPDLSFHFSPTVGTDDKSGLFRYGVSCGLTF